MTRIPDDGSWSVEQRLVVTRLDRLGAECTKARPEFDPDEIGELCDHAQALADAIRFCSGACGLHQDLLGAFDNWNEDQ